MKEGRNADCVDETDDGGRIGVGDDDDLEEIGDESVVGCGGGHDDDGDEYDDDDDDGDGVNQFITPLLTMQIHAQGSVREEVNSRKDQVLSHKNRSDTLDYDY